MIKLPSRHTVITALDPLLKMMLHTEQATTIQGKSLLEAANCVAIMASLPLAPYADIILHS